MRTAHASHASLTMASREEFVSRSLRLLALERAAELDEGEDVSHRPSTSCVKSLALASQKVGLYGRHVLVFESAQKGRGKKSERHLPANTISNGDIVGVLSGNTHISGQKISGVVIRSTSSHISVVVDDLSVTVDLSAHNGTIQLVKLANDVTYRRIRSALENLQSYTSGRCLHLISVLFSESQLLPPLPPFTSPVEGDLQTFPWRNPGLNTSQREAVLSALSRSDVAIIHGPPGTGKTTTVLELILQAIHQRMKVLACAPSNTAVDNLVEKLAHAKAKVVRLGHPARLEPTVLQYSLDAVVAGSESAGIILDVRHDIDKAYAECRRTRGASDRRKWRSEIKTLKGELRQREKKCVKEILSCSDVVLCTLTGASPEGALRHLPDDHFHLVVIDECAQALEASCWIALPRAPRCVLAGDHCQLPPTILSQEASDGGFSLTLMERLVKEMGEPVVSTLTTQYRMNSRIMAWPSHALYNESLIAHGSVENHLLSELPCVEEVRETGVALVFIDTAGCGLHELETEDSESKGNEGEADLVLHHIKKLRNGGVQDRDIAVIAPYSLQVKLVRQRLGTLAAAASDALEVHTVDGFQGREKEAVIITLTRSNNRGEYGFLKEQRRSNVAVTRARRHLCLIGDSETVSNEPFMKGMIESCHNSGDVWSAHEYMQDPEFEVFHFYEQKEPSKQSKGERASKGSEGAPPVTSHSTTVKPHTRTRSTTRAPPTKNTGDLERKDDEQLAKLQDTIRHFMDQSDSDVLAFPTSLTGNERRIVHELCEQFGLLHVSRGAGKERFIEVRKAQEESDVAHAESVEKESSVPQDLDHHEDFGPEMIRCERCCSDIPVMNIELHQVQCMRRVEKKDLGNSAKAAQKPKQASRKRTSKVKQVAQVEDLDTLLAGMTLADSTCKYSQCSKRVNVLGILCKFCRNRFCMEHSLAEVHGCGEAAKQEARRGVQRETRQGTKTRVFTRSQLETQLARKLEEKSNARQKKRDKETQ